MKSKSNLYELILTPAQTCRLSQMPTGAILEAALPGCICSDLFISGFSYKPLSLGVGIVAEDDMQYRLLKRLKSARFIADSVKPLPADVLLRQLSDGIMQIQNGYIGYNQEAALAVKTVRLPAGENLFGVQLRSGSVFRCFIKTENPEFPETLTLNDCLMEVRQVLPAEQEQSNLGILQHDMPLDKAWQVSGSASRFKLSFDTHRNCKVLCAGSVISRDDYFGNGVILSFSPKEVL